VTLRQKKKTGEKQRKPHCPPTITNTPTIKRESHSESEIARGIKQKHDSAANRIPVHEFKFARRGHNQKPFQLNQTASKSPASKTEIKINSKTQINIP